MGSQWLEFQRLIMHPARVPRCIPGLLAEDEEVRQGF